MAGAVLLFIVWFNYRAVVTAPHFTEIDHEQRMIHEAKAVFEQRLYFQKISEQERQGYIDTASKHRGWIIEKDDASYSDTAILDFPMLVTQTTTFANPANRDQTIVRRHLFIYDLERMEWRSLAETVDELQNGGFVPVSKTDIWD